jgi:hypothetical protein
MNIQTEDNHVWKAKCEGERAGASSAVSRALAGHLSEAFRRRTETAGEALALPRTNLLALKVSHVRAEILLRSFAVFLQVALGREKVRLCQRQRSGLCRSAKSLRVDH